MKLLDGLNEQQRQAVTSDSRYILCLAGAGTGKTRVLTHRVAYLNGNRIGTGSMLALTFTHLAGQEMKKRVIDLIGAAGEKLFCNTFHAFCVRLIREWGRIIGIEPNFTIYDQDDQESIIKAIIDEYGYSNKVKVKHVLQDIEALRSDLETILTSKESHKVAREYFWRLRQNNATDLDGLLYSAKELLTLAQPREDYHNRYKYVFIDEFQDTNDIQMEIIKLLDPENLFVVGDDFQSIYQFRGANVNLILDFPNMYPGCEVIKLEQNYRSTVQIIRAANNLISHNVKQSQKKLYADHSGVIVEELEFDDEAEEAEEIKRETMRSLTHRNYSDFAILARTNKQLDTIKDVFAGAGIPIQLVNGTNDVFKKHDIKMLFSTIEVALNPGDNHNLRKLLKFPYPRISQIELEECELKALDNEIPLLDVFENGKNVPPRVEEMLRCLEVLRLDTNEGKDVLEVFASAYELTSARVHYQDSNLSNRENDYQEAVQRIERWIQRHSELGESTTPQAFLRWLRLRDLQEKLAEEVNAVKLMTVHAAKGLEFPTVFIIGMNQGTFPHKKCQNIEEERRLFYVAVTRAKNRLCITRPKNTVVWGMETAEREESQFLKEILLLIE